MPILKQSDKAKSKSLSSAIDRVPSNGSSSSSGRSGSKFNLRFEKVSKPDETKISAAKKLKCVTSNFKCLFYKRNKGRESDGRSVSSKSSSPTSDSAHSSSPTEGFLSPELSPKVNEIPIPAERRSKTISDSSGNGTLDRPVAAPRTRPSIVAASTRIPAQQVIYSEQSSLHNFHLQSLGKFGPPNQILFRGPRDNFRHPPPPPPSGPPLPPRNNSNFPTILYAPRNHGPMVAYVRGPFPPSSLPRQVMIRPSPSNVPPPPHVVQVSRGQNGQPAFILRGPPPPRLLLRSPYEHPNCCQISEPPINCNHRALQNHCLNEMYGTKCAPSGLHVEDGRPPNMQLPYIPPRNQSLSAQSFVSLTTANKSKEELIEKPRSNVRFLTLQPKPLRMQSKENPSINNNHAMRKENSKVESNNNNDEWSSASLKKKNRVHYHQSDTDLSNNRDKTNSSGQESELWPTVLIDHKLPRVPTYVQSGNGNQRQAATKIARQLISRKASLDILNDNTIGNNQSKIQGSASCSDLRKMQEKNRRCIPWFRWFTRYCKLKGVFKLGNWQTRELGTFALQRIELGMAFNYCFLNYATNKYPPRVKFLHKVFRMRFLNISHETLFPFNNETSFNQKIQ